MVHGTLIHYDSRWQVAATSSFKITRSNARCQLEWKPVSHRSSVRFPFTAFAYLLWLNYTDARLLPLLSSGALVGGHKKEVVISGSCVSAPQTLDFYGWWLNGKAIQRNRFHESHYAGMHYLLVVDHSHLFLSCVTDRES